MLASEVIGISIRRPYAEVYEFLADPMNFTRWASNPDSPIEPLDGGEWIVDLPGGKNIIKFSPRNNFGVLDYQVHSLDTTSGPTTPARLIANEEGCVLQLTWFQRAGVDDERFRSEIEWTLSDLQRLKTLLEGG